MVAQELRRAEKEDEQHKAGGNNKDSGFHLLNGVTGWIARGDCRIGLTARVEGRAKSPVLNARAVAAVKIADCVS